jgi:NADPH-dependent curcumin reductase CurA
MVSSKTVRIKKTQLEGEISLDNIEIVSEDTPELKDGEVLVKNLYLSIDPTHRIYLTGAPSYFPGMLHVFSLSSCFSS